MNVIKRNGTIEPFDKDKIRKAVMKAAVSCDAEEGFYSQAELIADDIEQMLLESGNDEINLEDIQDAVEVDLLEIAGATEVAKSYILFREKKKQERDKADHYREIIRRRAITPDSANNRANANLDENSFSGRMYEANEDLWKETALEEFMPPEIAELHRKAELYLHDLSRFAIGQPNCLTAYIEPLLRDGFITRQVTLRSPSRFYTACQQIAVIFQILSQSQFGGIASGHIDRDLAPYVRKSIDRIEKKYPTFTQKQKLEELEEELNQGAEALIHNLATLQSRPGAQLPFSSLNLGADTSPEGRMVCRAILQAMINGVGPHHTTPPFPILCFQMKKGINRNPEDPNYDLKILALKCAAKRLTPNFVNLDCSNDHGEPDDPDTWLTAMGW